MIKSKESNVCPDCSGSLSGYDHRQRKLIRDDGTKETYRLRRLKCSSCGKLHLELPDIMQPFKHHETKVIESELSGTGVSCPADDSTIRVWRRQFTRNLNQLSAALKSLWMKAHKMHYPLLGGSLLDTLINTGPGWLTFVTQLCISGGFGIPTQFAFCP